MKDMEKLRAQLKNAQEELEQLRAKGRVVVETDADTQTIRDMMDAIHKQQAKVDLINDDLQAEEKRGVIRVANAIEMPANGIRASREYARAFADALREGIGVRQSRGIEKYRILHDAMTEGGGSPAGSAGGFLVPADVDVTIRETMRSLVRLADLFDVQNVMSNSGTRVKDVAPTKGFSALTGEATANAVKEDDQPVFSQVAYTLTTYGLNIPISNELVADEQANLFAYLGRYFAKKQVITENALLLGILDDLTPTAAGTGEDAQDVLRRILNTILDPDIALGARIITNQDGFQLLDSLKDTNERPLLQPDPTTGTPMLFKSHPITVVSNAQLPTPDDTNGVFYVGDFKQYGTLFVREPLEIASTIEGGGAWRSYSTEVRGIVRMCATKFDEDAAACYLDSAE